MKTFLLFVFAYIALFLIIDVLQKKVFTQVKWSRRATHVLSGVISFYLPVYLGKKQVMFIGAIFVLVLAFSKWQKMLAMHNTKRQTWGELFYPLTIMLMPFYTLPHAVEAFQFGVLILAFADGLAGATGDWLKYKPVKIMGNTKTLSGSVTFFITAFFSLIIMTGFSFEHPFVMVLLAMGLTGLEFILVYGTDNLVLPLLAAWVFILLS
jgi:dolichol kinase